MAQLRRKCKSFSLTSFDKWKHERDTTTTWHKNDIQHNKYYQWSGYWFSGFLRNATPLYTKWFLPVNNANIFRTDIIRNLAYHRGIQQAEKELDKNVLEIKKLIQKIGDLSKIKFKQKKLLFV